jgi:site-specific recombinase XerD
LIGKGNKERFLPIEEPLERILNRYLETRRDRFPKERHSPTDHHFIAAPKTRTCRSTASPWTASSPGGRRAGVIAPAGSPAHALRHT